MTDTSGLSQDGEIVALFVPQNAASFVYRQREEKEIYDFEQIKS